MWIVLPFFIFIAPASGMESSSAVVWGDALDAAVAEILADFSQSEKEERMMAAHRLVHTHKVRSVSASNRASKKPYLYEDAWAFLTVLYRSQLADRDHSYLNGWLAKQEDQVLNNLGEKVAQCIVHHFSKHN